MSLRYLVMNKNGLSVSAILNNHLTKYAVKHKLMLEFNDTYILICSNSKTLINQLANYFGGFTTNLTHTSDILIYAIDAEPLMVGSDYDYKIKKPDPGKTKIKEEYIYLSDGRIVRKRLTGMQFVFGRGNNLAVGPAIKNYNQVVNFINNRYIERLVNKNYLLAHAAGVICGKKGIAMSGFAGMGKSTLALNFMSKGAGFVSNDRLILKKFDKLHMIGVPKLPRVNPGTILNNPSLASVISDEDREEFLNIPRHNLWTLEHKYDVNIDKCFGKDKFSLKSTVDLVICLNWDRNGKTPRIDEVDINQRRDLLRNLMKSLGLFFESNNDSEDNDFSEEDYINCLEGTTVMEIGGGVDFDYITHECIRILKHEK